MAPTDHDGVVSTCEKEFVKTAIEAGVRLDGRKPYDFRDIHIEFGLDDCSAEVSLGDTRALAVVRGEIEQPFPDRQSEGSVQFFVDLTALAAPAVDYSTTSELTAQLVRTVERSLKNSRAIDLESLCIVTGRRCWALRVDIRVLDHNGNLVDVCILSALAALRCFRRPEVTLGGETGQEVVIHSTDVRESVPLSIHHLPIPTTLAVAHKGQHLVVDPTLLEENAMEGTVTVVCNVFREVCAMHAAGGVALTQDQVQECLEVACVKAGEVTALLKKAIEKHEAERVQMRVRRRGQGQDVDLEGAARPGPVGNAPRVESMSEDSGTTDDEAAKPSHPLHPPSKRKSAGKAGKRKKR
ncbi:unnamed protein product [Pedinophyceae sp. YPF-701]|nr:unnamed protein product [Pedinophyceae sp. YPF-701]